MMVQCLFTTTVIQPNEELTNQARRLALELGANYVPRQKLSLAKLCAATNSNTCFVVGKNKLSLYIEGKEYFFHPNMAKLRIFRLKKGEGDYLLQACALNEGMSFLDATMGLAGDSIVAAYATKDQGQVVGVEANQVIATLVKYGLQSYQDVDHDVNSAMRLVQVKGSDNFAYLQGLPNNAFDVVYFDPMFKHSVTASVGIELLRTAGDKKPLHGATLQEAKRVAKQRVVIKGRSNGEDFRGFEIDELVGGRYSSVAYGVIYV